MFQMGCNWQFISVDEFSFIAPANKATRRVILKASTIETTLERRFTFQLKNALINCLDVHQIPRTYKLE